VPSDIRRIDDEQVRELAHFPPGVRVSVYLPVDEGSGDGRRLRLAWQHAVEEARRRLGDLLLESGEIDGFAKRLEELDPTLRDLPHPTCTLAVLADPRSLRVYGLARAGAERVAAGRAFALRPLLRESRACRPYRVLAVSVNRVALYDGDVDGLREVPDTGLPASLEDALGGEVEPPADLQRYGGPGGGGYHGQGASDERHLDLDRFCRAVARALPGLPAPPSRDAPLLLAADEAVQGHLRATAAKGVLHERGLTVPPDGLSSGELHGRVQPVAEEVFRERECSEMGRLERARAQGKYVEGLDELVKAAVAGRIRSLWIRSDAHVAGRIDENLAQVAEARGGQDALDELAEAVLRRGGEVHVVDEIPGDEPAVAELR